MSDTIEETKSEEITLKALDLASEPKEDLTKSSSLTSVCSSGKNNEYNEVEINRLKDLISQKEADNALLESRIAEIEQQSKAEMEKLNASLNQKLEESLKKIVAESQKDKNSMVMKYVEVERKCIELNKTIHIQQSKLNDSVKEKQHLVEKIEKAKLECDKLNKDNETKLKDLIDKKKEIDKLREKIVLNDAKEAAAAIKLKTETDAHLVTKNLVEELKAKIKAFEENPKEVVETEVETQSLRPVSPVNSETEILKKELNLLKNQVKEMFEERGILREKVKQFETERNSLESSLAKYKETLLAQKNLNKDLLNENLQLREQQETWTK